MEKLEIVSDSRSKCCFCFKSSDFISNSQKSTTGIAVEVYNSCMKHINRDYLNSDEFLHWKEPKPLPFCRQCLRWTLKLTQMNNELEQIQKQIRHLVNSFTAEFIKLREHPNIDPDSDIEELSSTNSFLKKLLKIKLERPDENFTEGNERAEPELSPFGEQKFYKDDDPTCPTEEVKSQIAKNAPSRGRKKEKTPRQKKSVKKQLTAAADTNVMALLETKSDEDVKPISNIGSRPRRKVAIKPNGKSAHEDIDNNGVPNNFDGSCSNEENTLQTSTHRKSNNKSTATRKRQKVGDKIFKCYQCDKVYKNRHYLREHELTHDKSKRFKCTICEDVSYAYIQNLRSHLIKHKHNLILTKPANHTITEKRFKCQQCSKSYTTNYQLKGHERTHDKNKRFECTVCGISYAYIRNLRHHLLAIHQLYLTKCENQQFSVTTEKPEKQVQQPKEKVKKYFECKICGKKCNSPGQLYYHRAAVHEAIPHTCNICNKEFRNTETLKCHNRKIHRRQQKHQCTICNKEFGTSNSLKEHTMRHNRDPNDKTSFEQFKCHICQKTLSSRSNLKYHILRHNQGKRFECPLKCGKTFSTKSNLETHVIYHKGEKTFLCEECGRVFFTPGQLKNHTRIHTGLLHFCEFCGKGFQTTTNLKKHFRSHDRKRDKTVGTVSSSSSPSPVIVINEQMADRKYTCTFCEEAFDTRAILTEHMSLHDSDADDSSVLCFPIKY